MRKKNKQEGLESLKSKKYWPKLDQQLKKDFGQKYQIIKKTTFPIKLPSQKDITIESRWYDYLVLSESFPNLIEIKFSKRNHNFGAFTIGEWILAYLSLHNTPFKYHIYFIDEDKNHQFTIRKLNLNFEKLEYLLSSLQFKLYFDRKIVNKLFPENPISKDSNTNLTSKKTLFPIIDEFKKSLKKFVEYYE